MLGSRGPESGVPRNLRSRRPKKCFFHIQQVRPSKLAATRQATSMLSLLPKSLSGETSKEDGNTTTRQTAYSGQSTSGTPLTKGVCGAPTKLVAAIMPSSSTAENLFSRGKSGDRATTLQKTSNNGATSGGSQGKQ